MFCHRNSFKLVASFSLLSLVFTPTLLPVETLTVSAQDERQEKGSQHQGLEIEKKHQRVFAPHWTTEATYSTTVYIRNVHITQAVLAKVSLILDHRTIALPDTFVDSLQTVSVDVEKALRESGERTEQSGGAAIDFEAESAGAINAYAQVLDTTRSLSFSFPFMQDGLPLQGRWMPLPGITARAPMRSLPCKTRRMKKHRHHSLSSFQDDRSTWARRT